MLRGIMYRTVAFLVSFSMFTSISTKPNPSSHIYFFDFSCLAESVATTTFIIALWQITAASISALYSLPLDPSTIASRFPDLLAILTSDVSVPAGSRTPYANTLAYLDLLAVARTNARLREDVFNGSGTAGAGAVETWTVLAAACLRPVETLRGELARLQAVRAEVYAGSAGRRGGSGGVKGGAPLGGLPASGTLSPVKKARLLTGAVKPSPGKKSVWEALQDPSATVPDLGGAVGATAVKNGDVKVPDLLAAGGGLYKKQDASTKPKSAEPAVGLIEYLLILIGAIKKDGKKESGRGKGASLEGMGKVTQKAFVDSEVLSLAVESVSRLLIAATKEDKYGFVQRSIPDVLECLLHCLIAIETHMTNPPGMADFPVSSSMILASEGLHGQIVYKEPLAAVHSEGVFLSFWPLYLSDLSRLLSQYSKRIFITSRVGWETIWRGTTLTLLSRAN
ncbi:hypothetical protein BC830DRAFT_170081 [Chytriomyces sp. MP71]|nr:hypothetical protein BC830DRAFT_170081 [Chytriomyces sp. MP71]